MLRLSRCKLCRCYNKFAVSPTGRTMLQPDVLICDSIGCSNGKQIYAYPDTMVTSKFCAIASLDHPN